jgi:signal transduction histidine kinase
MRTFLFLLLVVAILPLVLVIAAVHIGWYYTEFGEREVTNLEVARAVAMAFTAFIRDITGDEQAVGHALAGLRAPTPEQAGKYLAANAANYKTLLRFYWTSARGEVIASSDGRDLGVKVDEAPWFKQILGGADRVITDLRQGRDGGPMTFTIASGIRAEGGALEGEVRDYALTIRHTSGRAVDVLYNATVYRNEAGEVQGVFAAARDVTERKKAEAELEKYRQHLEDLVKQRTAELEASNRQLQEESAQRQRVAEDLARSNRDLEQFAYVASHDLQEPLRIVSGYLQLLERRYKGRLDHEADEFIHFAVDGAARMQTLIHDLLAYSHVGMQERQSAPVPCESVLAKALANLQQSIADTGTTVTHDPLPTVLGDVTEPAQVFQNLIGNAIKFRGNQPPRVHVSARPRWSP